MLGRAPGLGAVWGMHEELLEGGRGRSDEINMGTEVQAQAWRQGLVPQPRLSLDFETALG